ncbi:MAG: protoporphyrinogen oxidase [Micromonosporaceae bacterium]|nr:protoporphyrinogen oxidase [Micromonosporaceae bacterium]
MCCAASSTSSTRPDRVDHGAAVPVRVAVVGGGITGLAAALRLRDRLGLAAEITVYEQQHQLGGKLRTGSLAGRTAERGADAFLIRDPSGGEESAAVALARRVGLGDELVHPRPLPAAVLVDGELRPIPAGTLVGVPGDLDRVAAVAQPAAERDRDAGRPLLAAGADVSVGELVRRRLGDQVVDRLVDPMLGGVYAGRADALSLAATMPGLAAACRTEPTLVGAVRAALAAAPRPAGTPVFAAVRGGMSRLVEAVEAAAGATVRRGRPVRELVPTGAGWRLVVGSTRDAEQVAADAVVLALPSRPAARLLRAEHPEAAALVGELDYASVALVTLAVPGGVEPPWTGFLVPAAEGTAVKAATFLSQKWGLPDEPRLVRASVGRYGDEQVLRLADDALVHRVHAELGQILRHSLGQDLPLPVAAHVQRWGGALPQYAPGHPDRVAAVRAALPDTLLLAGAGYDGVGIPACIRSGQTAADAATAALEQSVT